MSSLKNATKKFQRLHRERAQPSHRRKFGYLEKKKDYKVRATDHQKKEKALKVLRQKALDKNPNEFYYHMVNAQIKGGVHYEKKKEYTPEQLKLIKYQDTKYIAYKRKMELEKIAKLKATLHLISVPERPQNKRTVFVDYEDEVEAVVEKETEDGEYEFELLSGLNKQQQKAYKELQKREERAKQLTIILNDMTGQGAPPKKLKDEDSDSEDMGLPPLEDEEDDKESRPNRKKNIKRFVYPQERKK